MDINITLQHKVDPAIVSLLTQLLAMAANPLRTVETPAAPEQEDGRDPPAPPVKRTRKAAAPAEAPPAAAPSFAPPPPATQPSPVPIAAVKAAPAAPAPSKGPSMDELAVLVKQTLARVGTPGTRAVFNQFGIGRLLDLKPEQATAFAAALQAAEGMVATS